MRNLPPIIRKGDKLNADVQAQHMRATEELQRLTLHNLNLDPNSKTIWIGILDWTGKTQYTNEQYWVKRARCNITSGDSTADLNGNIVSLSVNVNAYEQVTVTNFPELLGRTHLLEDGLFVIVYGLEDTRSTGTRHYIMSEAVPFDPSDIEDRLDDLEAVAHDRVHQLLDSNDHDDTLTATPANGSILVGNATSKWNRVLVGTQYKVVQSTGTGTDFDWVRAH